MRFSQRMGMTEVRTALQVDSMDEALRNNLWDAIYIFIPKIGSVTQSSYKDSYHRLYRNFFHLPLDTLPYSVIDANNKMRGYFFNPSWTNAYDLLEFFGADFLGENQPRRAFYEICNKTLETHLAGYRFIDSQLVPVTDNTQINAIESALLTPLSEAREHLSRALGLLSDRESPDPRNSIKEAISAVEALCKKIVDSKTATLGAALKVLETKGVALHPALRDAWLKLYGYTNDTGGIRHALSDGESPTSNDALYFLVSASAFVSLLAEKAASAGLTLEGPSQSTDQA